jgi:hypothetical protein
MPWFSSLDRRGGIPAASVCAVATAALLALWPSGVHADRPAPIPPNPPVKAGFDVSRFDRSFRGAFEPFVVTTTLSIRDALKARVVTADTDVLVTSTAAGPLALLTEQMAYHHVAQGTANGREWLVSFCVVCNTATRLTPRVNGTATRFAPVGAYDGLLIIEDAATGTIWNHITGEALYGPAVGTSLGPPENVLHTTVRHLASTPDARVAISDRAYFAGGKRHGTRDGIALLNRTHRRPDDRAALSDIFVATLGGEDARRPRMELGLGIWWEGGSRYYPRDLIRESGNVLIDRVNGQTLLVYIDPGTAIPAAMFVAATRARVDGRVVRLDDRTIRDGMLLDNRGRRLAAERPLQVFTRWYGFALTFPGASIYGAP